MATMHDIKQGKFTIEKCFIEQRPNGGWSVELPPAQAGEMPVAVAAFSDTKSLLAYLGEKLNK
jgi:hypothetical protein